ncbi:MAG: hypothetical protein NT123_01200 [Proteobacteria bacterium]|nr:hypothetical protein [Pseudomonadota bacterium]
MTANPPPRKRLAIVLNVITTVVCCAIAWEAINIFVLWPSERKTIRLLQEKQAMGRLGAESNGSVKYGRIRQGISFAEFKSIAQEHGLKWRPHPEMRGGVRFTVSSPICRPHATFENDELYEIFLGCLN